MIINYPVDKDQDRTIFESEDEGYVNLVLVAVRYTGNRSSISPNQLINDAAWPHRSPFQGGPESPDADGERLPGPAKGALIADWVDESGENRTVQMIEAHPDYEVLYRPEEIARAMLEANYLDPKVFGQGYEPELRERVFDYLGLEEAGVRNEAEYRRQLREVAGVDEDPVEAQARTRDDKRVTAYRQDHTRSELVDAATILGHDDADGEGMIALATWLADQDPEAVRFAFEGKAQAARDVNAGDAASPEDAEPFTTERAVEIYDFEELKDVVKNVREGTGEFSLRGVTAEDMAAFLVETKGLTEDEIDGYLTG